MSKNFKKKNMHPKSTSKFMQRRDVSSRLHSTSQDSTEKKSFLRTLLVWPFLMSISLGITLTFYFSNAIFDFEWGKSPLSFFEATLITNPESVTDAVGNLIELLAAILGLVVTVVAIVVQLASQRYTTKLVDLFLEDKINRFMFGFMIFSVMYSVLIVYSIKSEFYPFYGVISLLIITLVELSLLLPYFNYVFKFLSPMSIISEIRGNTNQAVKNAMGFKGKREIAYNQLEVSNSLEQITDTALSANSQMNRNVGLMAIHTIRKILMDYHKIKRQLKRNWYQVSAEYFVGISEDFYQEILDRKIWVEAKAFMNMELIFKTSIRSMPDAISAIALDTRLLGEEAIQRNDKEVLKLVIEYYNTFLRISLNDKNQKAIYNLFYQYKLLNESIFSFDLELALKVLFYFKYYGQTALQGGIWFILVTASFDLGSLVASAYNRKLSNVSEMLDIFLEVDDVLNPAKDFNALKGVRKSQLILAAYLTSKGDVELVEKIVKDFKRQESFKNLIQFRDELLSITDKKFWEVTDRGINFEYIDTTQKSYLCEFYETFILPYKEEFQ